MNRHAQLTGQPVFCTARLRCRKWRPEDLDRVVAVYSNPVAVRWVDDGAPITMDEAQRWLAVTGRNYGTRGYGMFALELAEEVIGFIGLVHPNEQPEVEVKYAFLQRCWGKGYASEAVAGALAYANAAHGIDHIIATVAPQNLASQRVLMKCGFQETSRLEDSTLVFTWGGA